MTKASSTLASRVRAFVRRRPRLAGLALAGAAALGLLALGEAACAALLRLRAGPEPVRIGAAGKGFMVKDALLGYKPKPHARERAALRIGNQTIFDTIYTTDAFGRRVTPLAEPAERAQCALFFGGSYTFGEGVADADTLPAAFGRLCPEYQPYNYGAAGYGPQQMLAKLQSGQIEREVPQRRGIAVYTFMRHHIARAIGDMHVCALWGADMPYYAFGPYGGLVRRGSFRTGRPWTTRLYMLVGRSRIARYFRVSLPPRLTPEHLRLTAAIIAEAKREFERRFQSAGFFVVMHPASAAYAKPLARELLEAAVICLDYSGWRAWRAGDTTLPQDHHPNAAGHFAVAQRLARDVRAYRLAPAPK